MIVARVWVAASGLWKGSLGAEVLSLVGRSWTLGCWTGAEAEREGSSPPLGCLGLPLLRVEGSPPSPATPGLWWNCPAVDPRPDRFWCQDSLEPKALSAGHMSCTYLSGRVGSSSGVWLAAGTEGGGPDGGRESLVSFLCPFDPQQPGGRTCQGRDLDLWGLGYTGPASGGRDPEILASCPCS